MLQLAQLLFETCKAVILHTEGLSYMLAWVNPLSDEIRDFLCQYFTDFRYNLHIWKYTSQIILLAYKTDYPYSRYAIMKQLFSMLLLLVALTASAQKQIDSLSFCSIKYKVPADAKAESEYQIQGSNYSMMWLYMNQQMMDANLPEQFISQMEGQMKKFKKEPIAVFLLGNKVKGYKVNFKKDNGTGYQIIAYGTANEQPVLVQLSLNTEPKSNADIPEFARQIVKLSK